MNGGIHTCSGTDTWLADVLERIVSGRTTINQLDTLLPWNWSAGQVRQAA
ncbi:hypothetical protein FHT28_001997 [Rhizobium sp. SG570]|nr:hypothetical protein [Rhizobium sp. SG570]